MSRLEEGYEDAAFVMGIWSFEGDAEDSARCLHIASSTQSGADWILDADIIGMFEQSAQDERGLVSFELTVWDVDNQDIYPGDHPSWDRERDEQLFVAQTRVSVGDADPEVEIIAHGNDYDIVCAAYDACDVEAIWAAHGGYGSEVCVQAVLEDRSPLAFGKEPSVTWEKTFDDSAYVHKLAEIGDAVREGMTLRDEIKDSLDATDEDIDLAEAVYSRESGFIKRSLSEAPGMDAPIKRNAEARTVSAAKGTTQKRDVRIRR